VTSRSRTPLVLAVVLAVVALVALAAVVLTRGDDDDPDESSSTVPDATGGGEVAVDVSGPALAPLPNGGADPAVGTAAPALSGADYAGTAVAVEPGTEGPMMVVFLAHWCPHCNEEIPVLQQWEEQGGIPEDLQVVGVSTAVSPDRPNYPPDEWLAEKGWAWPVLADDGELTAANAYGVTAFPFMTFIDADGNVTARASGELPIEELQSFAEAAVA
jgi:cytochrome c biogenesis protein CcmG, thiol:disulfide interchange protein DsbE